MTSRLALIAAPSLALVVLGTLGACSFKASVGSGSAQAPVSETPAPVSNAPAPTPVQVAAMPTPKPIYDLKKASIGRGPLTSRLGKLGKLGGASSSSGGAAGSSSGGATTSSGGSSSSGGSASGGTPDTGLAAPLSAPSPFGSGTLDPEGFTGLVFFTPAGLAKFPDVSAMPAAASLWTRQINVAPGTFASGFAGLNNRKENFAIRYEGPLEVKTGADYTFRLAADDGALLAIDDLVIVDNDGVKTAAASKTGPVHLVPGTHLIRVDYFQATGDAALQLYCTKAGGAEKLCASPLD